MTDKQAKILFCVLAVPAICLTVWGSVKFGDYKSTSKTKPYVRVETDLERIEKAKLPVRIYRGIYDGKEIIIRMYESVR